jgi:hypothetical protein
MYPLRFPVVIVVSLACTGAALAQSGSVRWQSDAAGAVRQAQQSDKPLMLYVRGSTDDRSTLERSQDRALRDPAIVELAREFTTARISTVRNRDLMEQLKIPPSADLSIYFRGPAGDDLGQATPDVVGDATRLRGQMRAALTAYGQVVYKRLQPVLENEQTGARDLAAALRTVQELRIKPADAAVAAILQRETLDTATRRNALRALAALETKTAVTTLLELSLSEDRAISAGATSELQKSRVPAAAPLLDVLSSGTPEQQVAAYQAIGRIVRARGLKPASFWATADEEARAAAFAELRGTAEDALRAWKEEHGDD